MDISGVGNLAFQLFGVFSNFGLLFIRPAAGSPWSDKAL